MIQIEILYFENLNVLNDKLIDYCTYSIVFIACNYAIEIKGGFYKFAEAVIVLLC